MIPHFSIQPSLSLTVPRFSLSCPSILFFLSYFSFLLNSVSVCVCVCVCAADPGGLGNQLPLLPDPKAIASVLKCLQCRLGHSFFHPGRAGAPGLIGQNDDVKFKLLLEKC